MNTFSYRQHPIWFLAQVVPTLEAKNPAIRTWRITEDGGPANLPTSVIYMDLPVQPLSGFES